MKNAYYNENDPYAAQWLRNLCNAGHLPGGTIDDRSIVNVRPEDTQATSHFFAGIGGWPYALRLAGWPDEWPVWTGSCPCQPFSGIGAAKGMGDERHLWPAFRGLIAERNPPVVLGEQVAGSDGLKWISGVRVDLEALGYAVGCADLPAACEASPHIRQRIFWVAESEGFKQRRASQCGNDAQEIRRAGADQAEPTRRSGGTVPPPARSSGANRECGHGLGDSEQSGLEGHGGNGIDRDQSRRFASEANRSTAEAGFWANFGIVWCRDPEGGPDIMRRVEPGTFPVAHGISNRVGKLRAYGNAIVPQVAARFIKAYLNGE